MGSNWIKFCIEFAYCTRIECGITANTVLVKEIDLQLSNVVTKLTDLKVTKLATMLLFLYLHNIIHLLTMF